MSRRHPRPPAARRRGRPFGWLWFLKWTATAAIWCLIAGTGIVAWYAYDLPDVRQLDRYGRQPSISVVDRRGDVVASFGDLYGLPVRLGDLPPYLPRAVLAMEDRRFYRHFGLDLWGLLRAAYVNLSAGSIRQGGSTITQQLAKNLFLTPERSFHRKMQEAVLALWLEHSYSKDQILSLYLNRVYFGNGTYGVDAAARRYFGRPASRVSVYQAAMLAGLLKAPSRYNPVADPEKAAERAALVLGSMTDAGYLTPAQARNAEKQRTTFSTARRGNGRRYFADWVLDRVSGYVGFVDRDLVVITTLDSGLQRLAEQHATRMLRERGADAKVDQAAMVVLTPDGSVRAMVGGRDYGDSQFNRATQALRQPGSAFKTFVYLTALQKGVRPDDRFLDAPVTVGNWTPRNYGDRFHGDVTLREAMTRSLNSVAVRVSQQVGAAAVVDTAKRLGITAPLDAQPSIALGASEVSLLELTGAYATLANNGIAVWPHGIVEIRDRQGNVLYRRQGSGAGRVLDQRTVEDMNDLLRAVISWGTGRAAKLDRPAAGKTGTSQDFRDAWFVGYTPDLITGVWMGNDDSAPMKGVTGGSLPARLWAGFMKAALKDVPPTPLPGVGW